VNFRIVGNETRATGAIIEFLDVALQGPDGSVHSRDVIRHPGGVGVLPILGDDVVLVRQYRVALDRPILEIPAGRLEPGEAPEIAGRRELVEELGMAGRLLSLGPLHVSPGYTDEIIHLFAAVDIVASDREPHGAEELEAEVIRLPLTEALEMVGDGRITDAKTQIALLGLERSRE
jgi:ADP-ribose pyrophosphatase